MPVEALLAGALDALHAATPFEVLHVAVSGGSDSMALLYLSHGWATRAGVRLTALTVDHGLRPEAAAEAGFVAASCAGLGVAHQTLHWRGWDGRGNLQQAARAARYDLLAGAADAGGAILLGHTADDLAETFLMRLARGSGVDGLAAMRAEWQGQGHRWARPLLAARRDDLRAWLTAQGLGWRDDPSNENNDFDRVKARRALAQLAPLGLGVERLASTAGAMRMARDALEQATFEAARGAARVEPAGDVVIDTDAFGALPPELQGRLLTHALRWVSGAPYRPRRAALHRLMDDLAAGRRATLHGCLVTPRAGLLRIGREPKAVADLQAPPGTPWDGRWYLAGPEGGGDVVIGALGEAGLALCPDWRESGIARSALLASPAVRDRATGALKAAPLAGCANGWMAKLRPPWGDFYTSTLSH